MLRIAQEALTFDDVLLLPGYSEVTAKDVSLATKLTRNISLNLPLVSAAMDTVTESGLAIALAQEGGIGIVHKNLTVQEQAEQVRRVKKFESGVVKDPITIDHTATIAELIELTRANGISGVPVMKDGDLTGIVTRRDLRFETDTSQSISAIMTPRAQLVTVKEGASSDEVQRLLHQHRIEKILVVDDRGALAGLITVKDFDKAESFPDACKDQYGFPRRERLCKRVRGAVPFRCGSSFVPPVLGPDAEVHAVTPQRHHQEQSQCLRDGRAVVVV